MAPKKKKKPATNPARGFATTSLPSKSKIVEGPGNNSVADDTDPQVSGGDGSVPTPASDKDGNTKPGEVSSQAPNIEDMTPEELEAHLENSQLEALLDKYAVKAIANASRQVARLENERRQLRQQARTLSTYSWLPDETIHELSEMVTEHTTLLSLTAGSEPSIANEEELAVDLWTLERVLQSLNLPRTSEVLARVVELAIMGQLTTAVDSLPGMIEALQWYASNTEPLELPNYEQNAATRLEQRGDSTPNGLISGE
jgi:ATP-dependent RNA helicase DHX29